MKNFIPLVLAVLLGLAAVLAVGRLLRSRDKAEEQTSSIVVATRDIAQGDVLSADAVGDKKVPVSARPAQAISWFSKERVVGQTAMRAIAQGDYVLMSDIGLSRSMSDVVGVGEWAVTLKVARGGIAGIVQPGDEVAVIGTFRLKVSVPSADLAAAPQAVDKETTLVLFPRVRILDVGLGVTQRGQAEFSEIIVALPPQQAQVLIAAQREGELTLALRRNGDNSAVRRQDAGMVDAITFESLLKDLETVKVPQGPAVTAGVAVEAAKP